MEIFRYHKIWYVAKGSFSVKNPAVNGGVFDTEAAFCHIPDFMIPENFHAILFKNKIKKPGWNMENLSYSAPASLLFYNSRIPLYTFSAVIGSSRICTPTAFATAPAMAGDGVLITISPMDFAPNGPVGS